MHCGEVAAHEHMRDVVGLQDFGDCGDATAVAELGVDQHQVRVMDGGVDHRVGHGDRDRADFVTRR